MRLLPGPSGPATAGVSNAGTPSPRSALHRLRSQGVDATPVGESWCFSSGEVVVRRFTEAERTEVWDRWQGGEAMRSIARRLGRESSAVRTMIED